MAAVDSYLKKLLYQYDCIVVPELGAFLTHYQSAAFTEASGLYLPPRKRVAFNEALRFDDGILANYIMLHEPVTREEAQQLIGAFVSELRTQVETSSRFELEGIGTFTRNEENRLQFSPGLRQNFFGESYGMSAVPTQLVSKQFQPEPVLEAVPVMSPGPVLVRENDAVLTPYRPARTYWRVAAATLLIGSLGAFSYFSVVQPGQPFQSSLDPASLLRIPVSSFYSSTDREEVPELVTVQEAAPEIVPLSTPDVPVVTSNASVEMPEPVLARPEERVATLPEEKVAAPKAAPAKITRATAKSIRNKARKRTVAPLVEQAYTGPHFTVIAGVFSSKRNAQTLTNQLKKAGYADAFVIMPGRNQKAMYKVAATGSASRDEVVTQLDSIKGLTGSEPWILKN